MARLKAALIREYEDNDEVHIEVHNPRNTEAVTLYFRGEKLAKVRRLRPLPPRLSSLPECSAAGDGLADGQEVRAGSEGFWDPGQEELQLPHHDAHRPAQSVTSHTRARVCARLVVTQRRVCGVSRLHGPVCGDGDPDPGHPLHRAHLPAGQPAPQPHRSVSHHASVPPASCVCVQLGGGPESVCVCSGDVEQVEGASKITIRIFKSVTLVHEGGMVLLEVG